MLCCFRSVQGSIVRACSGRPGKGPCLAAATGYMPSGSSSGVSAAHTWRQVYGAVTVEAHWWQCSAELQQCCAYHSLGQVSEEGASVELDRTIDMGSALGVLSKRKFSRIITRAMTRMSCAHPRVRSVRFAGPQYLPRLSCQQAPGLCEPKRQGHQRHQMPEPAATAVSEHGRWCAPSIFSILRV
jgi:hypothetical protein